MSPCVSGVHSYILFTTYLQIMALSTCSLPLPNYVLFEGLLPQLQIFSHPKYLQQHIDIGGCFIPLKKEEIFHNINGILNVWSIHYCGEHVYVPYYLRQWASLLNYYYFLNLAECSSFKIIGTYYITMFSFLRDFKVPFTNVNCMPTTRRILPFLDRPTMLPKHGMDVRLL